MERNSKGQFIKIHGDKKTKLYKVWCSMKERCNNPNNKSYKNYGKKGIQVCELWENSYLEFKKWAISNGYKEGLTIDRIDFNKNYEPNNCRWVTTKAQNRNYSRNHNVIYEGKKYCLKELSELLDIKYSTLLWRVNNGYDIERAIKKGDFRYGNNKCVSHIK